jgi:hypothetical protein
MKYYFLGQIKCPDGEQVDMGPFVIPSTGGSGPHPRQNPYNYPGAHNVDFNFINKLDRS